MTIVRPGKHSRRTCATSTLGCPSTEPKSTRSRCVTCVSSRSTAFTSRYRSILATCTQYLLVDIPSRSRPLCGVRHRTRLLGGHESQPQDTARQHVQHTTISMLIPRLYSLHLARPGAWSPAMFLQRSAHVMSVCSPTSSSELEGARVLRPKLCSEYTRSRPSTHSHRRCASATCAAWQHQTIIPRRRGVRANDFYCCGCIG